MDFLSLMKALVEAGVLVVIASIFLMQQSKLFSKQEQLIEVLTKLERNLNNDTLKGKALELCSLLKVQEMRRVIHFPTSSPLNLITHLSSGLYNVLSKLFQSSSFINIFRSCKLFVVSRKI